MKKKEIQKVLAVLLAAAMCTTACGKTDTTSGSEKKESETVSSSTPASSETTEKTETKEYWQMLDEVSDTSELPDWTGEKLELTVWYAHGTGGASKGDIPETNVTFKELERVTGISFNVEESFDNGGDSQDAKLPKVIASKNYPHLMVGAEASVIADLTKNGYLVDMSEYFGTEHLYGFEYWMPEELGKNNVYQKIYQEDGSITWLPSQVFSSNLYSLVDYAPDEYDEEYWGKYGSKPANQGGSNYTSANAFWVRDDVLKAVRPEALTRAEIDEIYMETGTFTEDQIFDIGLETAEDFYQLLRDIKAEIDTGNYVGLDGKKLEVTYGPHTETDNWDLTTMAPAWVLGFGALCNTFTINVLDDDPSTPLLQKTWENETFVEYLRSLNALVNEDIMSKTSFVDNAASFKEKGANGHYAVSYGNAAYSGFPNTETLEAEGVDYGYRPVYIKHQNIGEIGGLTVGDSGMMIDAGVALFKDMLTEEQVEQVIHALSYLASPVGANNFIWGPASAGLFTEDAEGNRTYTDQELIDNMIYKKDNEACYKYGIIRGTCPPRR